ncbi:shikimate kinase [Paenibacillus agricola]|uniref:Shikimate kinase n=1 Tax=Paenibacillus agricola TaxID=2716264 RepID=A0ABX0J095_9BACL|nr:shikimate kinase [Paenibacillus agricola]NHN28504.1 shikimate kinase [Paenibacillus agricola]
MKHKNIIIVGFMGTGKTAVGKAMAERLGWRFVDTDHYIESKQGTTISDMFRDLGEPAFRNMEGEAIAAVLEGSRQVVATGGGAVLAEHNRVCMQQEGYVVALKAAPEVIINRVKQDEKRPLVQGDVKERVYSLLEARKHAYDFADLIIDSSTASVEEIVEQVIDAIQ